MLDTIQDLKRLDGAQLVAFDVETTGLRPTEGGLRLIQLGAPGCGDPIVLDHWAMGPAEHEQLRQFFSTERFWVAHNAVFDTRWLQHHGYWLPQSIRCTMLADILVFNGKDMVKHGLKDLANRYLGHELDKSEQRSNWAGDLSFNQIEYARKDVQTLLDLWDPLMQALETSGQLSAWYAECSVINAMAQMERWGLKWDMPRLKRVQIEYERKAEELREKFLDQLQVKGLQLNEPCELNLNSPKQMLSVFTETIGEEPVDEDGKPSVAKPVLENYTLDHPEVTAYLTWKRSKKRASMIGTIKKEAETEAPYKDVTRCSYRQLGAMTGRMSAVQPNLQQVPRDPDFRGCVIARPGYRIVAADYSQMELRLAGVESDDEAMCKAFMEDKDLHTLTAKAIYGTDEPTSEQRRVAKSANFGLLYGAGADGLRRYAISMGIRLTIEEATEIRDKFFNTYTGIREWQRANGFAATRQSSNAGRWPYVRIRHTRMRRYLKGRKNRLTIRCNTVVQGAGAAVLKHSLANLWPLLQLAGEDEVRLVACVHDEILLEVREDRAEDWAIKLSAIMEDSEALWLLNNCGEQVLPKVDVKIGNSWADCK